MIEHDSRFERRTPFFGLCTLARASFRVGFLVLMCINPNFRGHVLALQEIYRPDFETNSISRINDGY